MIRRCACRPVHPAFEALEPRVLLSAAYADKNVGPAVVERAADTEYLFAAADAESDGVLILGAAAVDPAEAS